MWDGVGGLVSPAQELEQRLTQVLLQTDPQGQPIYPPEVLQDAIPLLILSMGEAVDLKALPPAVKRMWLSFCERSGLEQAEDLPSAEAALQGYLQKNPLPETLRGQLDQVFREALSAFSSEKQSQLKADFHRLMGLPSGRPAAAPKAAGGVAAGPLARTQLLGKLPSKKKGSDQ